ncbi:hypothetical protein LZ318_22150 [Saccharopolyspora indica]|uniref:hypothetical protein n=1 Tax=Saccharopolyspora indica TaxID=1229659 RepID=UPI0022EA3DE5|nr:hypothetical protein [Saccharopolyspora indica]MDA3648092.1 hypothetical protein [Saccharopolyspora indica]
MTVEQTCPSCGADDLEQGFLAERPGGSYSQALWVEGPVQRALFGGVKVRKRRQLPITAARCPKCFFLMFYAEPVPEEED